MQMIALFNVDRGGSVMVWGGIAEHGSTLLVVVAENPTGIRYRDEIVQRYVIPFIQSQDNKGAFQQNNARPHAVRVVRDYLTQRNVDVLPRPVVSPNLSHIEQWVRR